MNEKLSTEILDEANKLFVNNKKKSIELYQKFIDLTKDNNEDKWYSYFKIGKAYLQLNLPEIAIKWFLDGHNLNPKRSEMIYEITKHFRETAQYKLAQTFYNIGCQLPIPSENCKYPNKNIKILFDYEYSIFAFYLDIDKKYVLAHCIKLINEANNNIIINTVYNNLANYIRPLDKTIANVKNFTKNISYFQTSTPAIFLWPQNKSMNNIIPKYAMNIRLINYTIDKNTRRYDIKGSSNKLITRNLFIGLDDDLDNICETEIHSDFYTCLSVIGVEDIKILPINNELRYIGTVQDKDKNIVMNYGTYDFINKKTIGTNILSPNNRLIEKNWAMFNSNDQIKIIYQWHPIQIGSIVDNKLIINYNVNTPIFFSAIQGSTNGFLFNDQLWFITHCCIKYDSENYKYCKNYYHCIVIIDKDTFQLIKYSRPFQFEGENIEYTLGFVIDNDRFIVSYSLWDNQSKIVTYPMNYINNLFL